ncbi:MAG: hypothetical protein ACYCDV_01460 [Facklamia hominis]
MTKKLTAQEFADELGVTRQLIYYHAKKINSKDKIYEDNKLVFSPEQQDFLKSFMTDTVLPTKNQSDIVDKSVQENNPIFEDHSLESEIQVVNQEGNESPDFTYDPELAREIALVLDHEESVKDSSKEIAKNLPHLPKDNKQVDSECSKQDKITNEILKDEKREGRVESNKLNLENQTMIFSYIQEVVKDQLSVWVDQEHAEMERLMSELQTKNEQIKGLHQLLDQQQQLMLITEQKHAKLIEILNQDLIEVESDQNLKMTYKEIKAELKSVQLNQTVRSKNYLETIFK